VLTGILQPSAGVPVGVTRKPGGFKLNIRHRPLTSLAVVMPRIAPATVSLNQWRL
jgi:hypothetical protein